MSSLTIIFESRSTLTALCIVILGAIGGCHKLHAGMSEQHIREVTTREFPLGMSVVEVANKAEDLGLKAGLDKAATLPDGVKGREMVVWLPSRPELFSLTAHEAMLVMYFGSDGRLRFFKVNKGVVGP